MLLRRIDLLLGTQLLEGADDAEARVTRLDHIVDVAITCGVVRVSEELVVLAHLLRNLLPETLGRLTPKTKPGTVFSRF